MKKTLLITILATLLSVANFASAEKEASAKDIIASAEKAQKKAASVNGEWRDIGKFIKAAKAALKEGDKKKASQLAKKALQQSEDGYSQAMRQVDIAKDLPPYIR